MTIELRMNNLPSLLMQAARSAAEADGLAPPVETQENKGVLPVKAGNAEASVAAALTLVANAAGGNGNSQKTAEAGVTNGINKAENGTLVGVTQHVQHASGASPAPDHGSPAVGAVGRGSVVVPNGVGSSSEGLSFTTAVPADSSSVKSGSNTPQVAPQPAPQPVAPPAPAPPQTKKKGPALRRGKWTPEEEAYANRLILEFKAGLLPLTDGTTLRTFLSKLLNCDPMRISKKFVGSNCIGKQVFRRRTADINRLTPEQIQASQQELSELERRFLERVAQTNRVKSSSGATPANTAAAVGSRPKAVEAGEGSPNVSEAPTPPWLKPPTTFGQQRSAAATSAATAAAAAAIGSNGGANSRAAAAGRALLQGVGSSALKSAGGLEHKTSSSNLAAARSHSSAGLLALAEIQRRQQSQQSLLQTAAADNIAALGSSPSASGLAALNSATNGSGTGLSSAAMSQIARNASAARLAGLATSGHSMNNLMLKGLSRDQISQLARDQQLASSHSLSNIMERQSSFDALMSLDFQSLQSIDNLANLIQTGGSLPGNAPPKSGLKNWAPVDNSAAARTSATNLASLASARRLASEGRLDSLMRTLSSGNAASLSKTNLASRNSAAQINADGSTSNASFTNMLQNLQGLQGNAASVGSMSNLLGTANPYSAMSLASMLRNDSSTGLTALRMKDGLVQRNSSVDDFLSLVANGDIPHQDPQLLNVPLQSVMQQQQNATGAQAAAQLLAQQQLLAQAANGGSNALSDALAARAALEANSSSSSLLSQLSQGSAASNAVAAAFAQQQQQARAAQMNVSASALAAVRAQVQQQQNAGVKRKILESGEAADGEPPIKR